MIQANELRVGNWLECNGKFYKVVRITNEQIRANPIPLTEEWLVKFGFVFGIELQDFVKGKHQFIELNCLCGYFSENDIFYYAEKTKLKYVHQLQNLYFALTGKELTIKN